MARALSGATIQDQNEPGSNGNEGVLCISQSPIITGTSPLDCLVSYPEYSLVGGLPLCRGAVGVFYSPSRGIYIYIYIYIYIHDPFEDCKNLLTESVASLVALHLHLCKHLGVLELCCRKIFCANKIDCFCKFYQLFFEKTFLLLQVLLLK